MAVAKKRRTAPPSRLAAAGVTTVHVESLYKEGLAVAKSYREQGLVNESYVHGDQWDVVISKGGKRSVRKDAWYDDEDVPRFVVNEIGPGHQTWSALMTKDRPTVIAAPDNDSPDAAYKAAIGNVIIDFLEGELDTANKVHKATASSGLHGTGGIKVCFDFKKNKLTWSLLTLFDFVIDPRHPDWREAKWVIFEDYIDEDEALDAFEKIGVRKKPTPVPYTNANGDKLTGVRRLEFWHKPCRKYPTGCFSCIIDGVETEYTDEYPYQFEDDSGEVQFVLPLVLMRMREVRNSVYGATNLSAAVPMQHGYNEMVSRIQKEIRDRKTHLFLPDSCEDNYLQGTTAVFFPKKEHQAAAAAQYLTAGDIAQSWFSQRDFFQVKITAVIGLNQVTAGTESRTLSGRAIDNIVELDKDKNADATKEQQGMVREAWYLSWKIVGRFYTDFRKAKIANADPADVLAFNNADVIGTDIKLEPASELDKLSQAKKLTAVEGQQTGASTPLDLAKTSSDGAVGFAKQQSEELIAEWLAGRPIDPHPEDIRLDVFLAVIAKSMSRALAKRDRTTWISLEHLRRQIQALNGQAADAQPRAPAAEPTAMPSSAPAPPAPPPPV